MYPSMFHQLNVYSIVQEPGEFNKLSLCVYFIRFYVDPNVTDITAYCLMIFGYSSFTNFTRELNSHIFDRMIEVLYNQEEIASKVLFTALS